MICPECGYDMGNKNKCYRCGYEAKTLAVVNNSEDEDPKKTEEEKVETKVIDPCNVYITHPYGYEDYGGFDQGSPFSSLFDELFGDPISDLLGGLFGININPRRTVVTEDRPQQKPRKKQGPVIVVDDIEIIPADDDKKKEKAHAEHNAAHSGTHNSPHNTERSHADHGRGTDGKKKNIFRRNNRNK